MARTNNDDPITIILVMLLLGLLLVTGCDTTRVHRRTTTDTTRVIEADIVDDGQADAPNEGDRRRISEQVETRSGIEIIDA